MVHSKSMLEFSQAVIKPYFVVKNSAILSQCHFLYTTTTFVIVLIHISLVNMYKVTSKSGYRLPFTYRAGKLCNNLK